MKSLVLTCLSLIALNSTAGTQTMNEEERNAHFAKLEQAIEQDDAAMLLNTYRSAPEAASLHKVAVEVITKGKLELIKTLFENGLEASSVDEDGYSLLHDAVFSNHIDIARYLIVEKGLDVNARAGDDGQTIFAMTKSASVEMVELLQEHGLKIDSELDADIVQEALYSLDLNMAQHFLGMGFTLSDAAVNDPDLVYKVIQYQKDDILSLLLDKGLNIETQVEIYGGMVSLLQFATMIKSSKMTQFLIDKGANLQTVSEEHGPIISWVTQHGELELIELLLKAGMDPDQVFGQRQFENTALSVAFDREDADLLYLLMRYGADVNLAPGSDMLSPMHRAGSVASLEVVKDMVEAGGKVHKLDRDRKAPLDYAIRSNDESVIEYLREQEALQPGAR